jgi:hypothetical protein
MQSKTTRTPYLVTGALDTAPVVALLSAFLTVAGLGFAGLVVVVAGAWALWASDGASAAKAAPESAKAEIATAANNRFMMDPRGSGLNGKRNRLPGEKHVRAPAAPPLKLSS